MLLKSPILGTAKTRLAASIGDQAALSIYKELIAHTQSVLAELNYNTVIAYTELPTSIDGWLDKFTIVKQRGETLGERMSFAIKSGIHKFSKSCIIIGSDCYQLQSKHIREAAQALQKNDLVIGPAKDGGYYLIGMTKYYPKLFSDDIPWSTDQVFAQTIQRAKNLNLTIHLLDELSDVDTIDDLPQVLKEKYKL